MGLNLIFSSAAFIPNLCPPTASLPPPAFRRGAASTPQPSAAAPPALPNLPPQGSGRCSVPAALFPLLASATLCAAIASLCAATTTPSVAALCAVQLWPVVCFSSTAA
jgi:hypothetical protein